MVSCGKKHGSLATLGSCTSAQHRLVYHGFKESKCARNIQQCSVQGPLVSNHTLVATGSPQYSVRVLRKMPPSPAMPAVVGRRQLAPSTPSARWWVPAQPSLLQRSMGIA